MEKGIVVIGPGGVRLELDPTQVFRDGPGQGTPALVVLGKWSSTFSCALYEGVLDGPCDRELTPAQMKWLESQEEYVERWLSEVLGKTS